MFPAMNEAVRDAVTFRLRVYQFLALPAHAWLWVSARLCGMRFECGPVSDPADPLEVESEE